MNNIDKLKLTLGICYEYDDWFVFMSIINITVEPLLYDHPQNHIGVVV